TSSGWRTPDSSSALRWRTRWSRKRARSRSWRTSGVGSGDLRYQGSPGELSQHAGIDLVSLGRERCQAPHPLGIGDQDLPARELEAVVDEAGAVHRLDRRPDRLPISRYPSSERSE